MFSILKWEFKTLNVFLIDTSACTQSSIKYLFLQCKCNVNVFLQVAGGKTEFKFERVYFGLGPLQMSPVNRTGSRLTALSFVKIYEKKFTYYFLPSSPGDQDETFLTKYCSFAYAT